MQVAGCKMQDAGSKIQGAGCKMQGAGCGMQDAGRWWVAGRGALSRLIIQLTCDTIQPGCEEGATCGVLLSSASKTHDVPFDYAHDMGGGEGQ